MTRSGAVTPSELDRHEAAHRHAADVHGLQAQVVQHRDHIRGVAAKGRLTGDAEAVAAAPQVRRDEADARVGGPQPFQSLR